MKKFTVVLMLVLIAGSALAEDDKKRREEEHHREVEAEVDAHKGIEMKSFSKAATTKDRSSISLEVEAEDDELTMKVEYRTRVADTKASTRLRVRLTEIKEYKDTTAVAGFDPAVDTLGKSYTIGKDSAFTFSALPSDTNNGVEVKKFLAASNDKVISLVLHVPVQDVTIDSREVVATGFKFDVIINGTAFKPLLTGSKFALIARVKSAAKTSGSPTEVSFGADAVKPLAMFEWATSADCHASSGTTTANVIVSPFAVVDGGHDSDDDEHETTKQASFSFDAPDCKEVNWDPEVSVEPNSAMSSVASVMSVVVLAVLAVLFA